VSNPLVEFIPLDKGQSGWIIKGKLIILLVIWLTRMVSISMYYSSCNTPENHNECLLKLGISRLYYLLGFGSTKQDLLSNIDIQYSN